MNKTEFIQSLAKRLNLSEYETKKYLFETKKLIQEVLNKSGEIKLSNFGKFSVSETHERLCLNPITKRYFFTERKKIVIMKLYRNFKFSIK